MALVVNRLNTGDYQTRKAKESARAGLIGLAREVLLFSPREDFESADRALTGLLVSDNFRERDMGHALHEVFAIATLSAVAGVVKARVAAARRG